MFQREASTQQNVAVNTPHSLRTAATWDVACNKKLKSMGIFDKLFKQKKEPVDFPPKPKWKPNLPIDLELILE